MYRRGPYLGAEADGGRAVVHDGEGDVKVVGAVEGRGGDGVVPRLGSKGLGDDPPHPASGSSHLRDSEPPQSFPISSAGGKPSMD